MRRSSAPSAGASKRQRFAPPFASKSSELISEENSIPDQVKGVAPGVCKDKPPAVSTNSTTNEQARRPLTEILSLLDGCDGDCQRKVIHTSQTSAPDTSSWQVPSPAINDVGVEIDQNRSARTQMTVQQQLLHSSSADTPVSAQSTSHSGANSSTGGRYFEVLWGKKSARKHKKWEGDALLEVHTRHVILMDPNGTVMGQASGYRTQQLADLTEGSLLSVGAREIQVQAAISVAEWATRVDNSSATAAAAEPNSPAPQPQQAVPRPFVCPLVGAGACRRPGGTPMQPRHDPNASGALLMPEPSAEYQWNENDSGMPVVPVVVDPYLSRSLRPHQRVGVRFLYGCLLGFQSPEQCGAVLADEMGLGKTLQSIALVWTLLKQGPLGGQPVARRVLVITPSGLVGNWVREFNKWLGRERLSVYAVDQSHSVKDYMSARGPPVLIISYEMAVKTLQKLQDCKFDLIICDEGHRLKNGQIKTVQALSSLECSRRLLLTGTPLQNDLSELYALVQFVNPGALGSLAEFRRQFERPIVAGRQPDAPADVAELGEERGAQLAAITDRFILRRTADVLDKYLPPKIETVVFCRPSPLQVELYKQLLVSRKLQSLVASEGLHLVVISLLRKLCSHPALLLNAADDEESVIEGVSLPLWLGRDSLSPEHSGKMSVLVFLLRQLRDSAPRQKMVLIAYQTKTLSLLAELCQQLELTWLRLDGSTPANKRHSLVDRFNSSYGTESVFLLSAKAGGVGLNLVGASSVVLFELDWNPANDLQAMARVWRDGQKRTTRVYRLVTTGTIEEKVYQRQLNKQGLGAVVVDGRQPAETFSTDELTDLFTLDDGECGTHDLLGCSCNLDGELCSITEEEEEPQEETRPCQLTTERAGGDSGGPRLAQWQHFRGPLDAEVVQDAGLAAACDRVSFLFRTVVAAKFE